MATSEKNAPAFYDYRCAKSEHNLVMENAWPVPGYFTTSPEREELNMLTGNQLACWDYGEAMLRKLQGT